uniref:Large ribosomal subunit protein uL18c n=1 Tax=Membranoptera platyphylla TaxID=1204437 RepID=A0A1I9KQM2_9FLOR|nr:50S ribosomal protein L18 [Membranoptera platyphylla]AMJ16917.1 50S ribosomal protein L18 [Membranoptera platyphylla]
MKKKLKGSLIKPRLYVFKSNKHIYAQVIDDENNKILTSISTISKAINKLANCKVAQEIGKNIAQQLKKQNINKIVFDRGNNVYHGQVKALAEATRQEGIEF